VRSGKQEKLRMYRILKVYIPRIQLDLFQSTFYFVISGNKSR
jgi:hypothetical protein